MDEIARVLTPNRAVFRINNIDPAAAEGWWLSEFFSEAASIDAARFTVETELTFGTDEVLIREALQDAHRRLLSQLTELGDRAFEQGSLDFDGLRRRPPPR